MLIEVKAKVTRIIDDKTRRRGETFLVDKEFFSEAEYAVTSELTEQQNSHLLESFEITSLRLSLIKEIATENIQDEVHTFILTLRDTFHDDNGNEKQMKYKVLIGAESLSQAHQRAQELASQGYNMLIEGIKQVDYDYLNTEETNNE